MSILFVLLGIVGLIVSIIFLISQGVRKRKELMKPWYIVLIISLGLFILGVSLAPPRDNKQESKSVPTSSASTDVALSQEPQKAIETKLEETKIEESQNNNSSQFIDKVKEIGGKFDTTIWEGDNLIVDKETNPPYGIVINIAHNDVASCYYAKLTTYELLHKLYTADATKNKISRVLINAGNYLSVSLGYNDAFQDGKEVEWSGPTNFWNTMIKYKPYEDENGELKNRTWGTYIGSDCK